MNIFKKRGLLLILLSGFVLRLISLNQSLWLDEAITVLAVKNHSFLQIITQYIGGDFHPPGFYLLLNLWTKIFGYSEISARFPSVLFGVATIWIVYLLTKKLFSEKVGLLAAFLLAINPLHIYYSQEARMYSFAAFAVSLSFLFFVKLIKGEKNAFWGLSFATLLILGSDYVAYFAIPSQLIILVVQKNFSLIKKWLGSFLLGVLPWIWFIPIGLSQLQSGANLTKAIPGWAAVVGSSGIKPFLLTYVKFIIGRISVSDKYLYAAIFIPVGLIFALLIFNGIKNIKKSDRDLLLGWLLIPIVLGLGISLFIPIYDYFRVLFVLPAFVILVALGLIYQRKAFAIVAVILGELFFSLLYLFLPMFHREDWVGVTEFLNTQSVSNTLLIESSGNFSPLVYYNPKTNIMPVLKSFPANSQSDLVDLTNVLKKQNKVFLLNYLVDISDPNRFVSQELTSLGYTQGKIYNFNGVGFVYEYDR